MTSSRRFHFLIWYFLTPLLTFCFPLGVLTSQICEIFIVSTNSEEMIKSIQYITETAAAFEAFLECAPQIILQSYIIFISGQVTTTQIVTILCSVIMFVKTTIMYEFVEKGCGTKLCKLIGFLWIYFWSGYFRLGTIILSCIFFQFWTIIPVCILYILLFCHARSFSFSPAGSCVLALSNLYVVG